MEGKQSAAHKKSGLGVYSSVKQIFALTQIIRQDRVRDYMAVVHPLVHPRDRQAIDCSRVALAKRRVLSPGLECISDLANQGLGTQDQQGREQGRDLTRLWGVKRCYPVSVGWNNCHTNSCLYKLHSWSYTRISYFYDSANNFIAPFTSEHKVCTNGKIFKLVFFLNI